MLREMLGQKNAFGVLCCLLFKKKKQEKTIINLLFCFLACVVLVLETSRTVNQKQTKQKKEKEIQGNVYHMKTNLYVRNHQY